MTGFKVSFFVGLILNIINQSTELFNYEFDRINYLKTFLTFLVPFFVSIYSSTSTKLKLIKKEK